MNFDGVIVQFFKMGGTFAGLYLRGFQFCQQRVVQISAMDGKIVETELLPDFRSVGGSDDTALLVENAERGQSPASRHDFFGDAKSLIAFHSIRGQQQPCTERFDFRRSFKNRRVDAFLFQSDGSGKSCNTTAEDGVLFHNLFICWGKGRGMSIFDLSYFAPEK